MKKIAFLFLVFISALKIEGAVRTPAYSFEYSNKADIESLYVPPQSSVNFSLFFNSLQKQKGNISYPLKKFLLIKKLSLFYYNKYILHRIKISCNNFTHPHYFIITYRPELLPDSSGDDPFALS